AAAPSSPTLWGRAFAVISFAQKSKHTLSTYLRKAYLPPSVRVPWPSNAVLGPNCRRAPQTYPAPPFPGEQPPPIRLPVAAYPSYESRTRQAGGGVAGAG